MKKLHYSHIQRGEAVVDQPFPHAFDLVDFELKKHQNTGHLGFGFKHTRDQLKLLSEKKQRPALFERNAVMANLEKRETLSLFKPVK